MTVLANPKSNGIFASLYCKELAFIVNLNFRNIIWLKLCERSNYMYQISNFDFANINYLIMKQTFYEDRCIASILLVDYLNNQLRPIIQNINLS